MSRPADVSAVLDRLRNGYVPNQAQLAEFLAYLEELERAPDHRIVELVERFVRAEEQNRSILEGLVEDRTQLRADVSRALDALVARETAEAEAIKRREDREAKTFSRLWDLTIAFVKNPVIWAMLAGGGAIATAIHEVFRVIPVEHGAIPDPDDGVSTQGEQPDASDPDVPR
jgi:hypothetical protein